ncbi:DUF11 domain-containing protein [Candidatus Dojkabacteria bacterium]|uniref:DUF11 domain-containing protein n=1 Tax=Candidatus Dojkabacteria bacterium TaxID=2099670 RepID=A0A955L3M7_9BACT|nr:DUF11 domain-containing protein [Candidatus Dojkabacteria bacterium]
MLNLQKKHAMMLFNVSALFVSAVFLFVLVTKSADSGRQVGAEGESDSSIVGLQSSTEAGQAVTQSTSATDVKEVEGVSCSADQDAECAKYTDQGECWSNAEKWKPLGCMWYGDPFTGQCGCGDYSGGGDPNGEVTFDCGEGSVTVHNGSNSSIDLTVGNFTKNANSLGDVDDQCLAAGTPGKVSVAKGTSTISVNKPACGSWQLDVFYEGKQVCVSNGCETGGCPEPGVSADLAITKTDSKDPVMPGEAFKYNLKIENLGPDTAQNVKVSDVLPGNLVFQSVTQGCNFDATTRALSCSLANMPKSGTATYEVNVKLNEDVKTIDKISNTASVKSDTFDPNMANNTDTELTSIVYPSGPDLEITKTGYVNTNNNLHWWYPDSYKQFGEYLTYFMTVTNNGTATANDVVVTDQFIPATRILNGVPEKVKVMYLPSYSSPSCTLISGDKTYDLLVGCKVGNIAPGATAKVYVSVVPYPYEKDTLGTRYALGQIINDACIQGTDNCDREDLDMADFEIVKNGPELVRVGKNYEYTLNVKNYGPYEAANVQVFDQIPSYFTLNSVTTSRGTCEYNESTRLLRCRLASDDNKFYPGNTATVKLNLKVNGSSEPDKLCNTADVRSGRYDPYIGNNTSTFCSKIVEDIADVTVIKTATPEPAMVGGNLNYTFTVKNIGDTTADNVTLTDNLPSSLDYSNVAVDTDACDYSSLSGKLTCDFGSLNADTSVVFHVSTKIAQAFTGSDFINTAYVATTSKESNYDNNQSSWKTTVNRTVNMTVTKTDDTDPVTAGGSPFNYNVKIVNNGPAVAHNVYAVDTLPAGFSPLFATGDIAGGSCTINASAWTFTCELNGDLAVGQTWNLSVNVQVQSYVAAGTYTNIVTAYADENTKGVKATEDTTVLNSSDVGITKTDDIDPANPGDVLTYTLTVTNYGVSVANNVNVADTLPDGLTFLAASPTQGSCTYASGVVSCSLGSMAVGSVVSIAVVTQVDSDTLGVIYNTATVTTTTPDNNPDNNSVTIDTTVKEPQVLGVTIPSKLAPTGDSLLSNLVLTAVMILGFFTLILGFYKTRINQMYMEP